MTKDELILLINDQITTNGNNEITGAIASMVLTEIVNSIYGAQGMGSFMRFRGLATPSMTPVTPKINDIYLARWSAAGTQTYTNFSAVVVSAGELALLRYNGAAWVKQVAGTIIPGTGSGEMTAEEIRDALETLTDVDRLNKTAIKGLENVFNMRGKADISNYSAMTSAYGNNTSPGDVFVASNLTSNIGFNEGDWIIALVENPSFEGAYQEASEWLPVKFNNESIIKTRLQALTAVNRLSKTAIRGGEFALNRKGKVKWDSSAGQWTIKDSDPQPGDYWIYDDGGTPVDNYSNGDILILLTDTLPDPTWTLTDDTKFEIWTLSKLGAGGTAMTPEQIAAALNTITVLANMVTSNRVKYNTNQTVQNKIDAMDSVIAGKQSEIFSKRIIMEGEISSFSLVVTGYIHPIQVAVNRVPYVGKQGSSFAGQLAGFDFRYEQANNVTTITTNPAFSPRLTFNPGDVVDILHSTVALRQDQDA